MNSRQAPEVEPTSFVYHPRTADQLDITPTLDGLGVMIGIYNNRDGGRYTTIDVSIPDVEDVIGALRQAKVDAAVQALRSSQPPYRA